MGEAETRNGPAARASGASEELYLGDAIHFFLSAKRAGGRSGKTVDDYRKKLELFQRWIASRYGDERGTEEVDAPYLYIGADEVESYVVHLRDERAMADSSRKNHLAVLRSFFQTVSKRLELADPTRTLDEVRFRSSAPKRTYLTKREAEILLSSMDNQVIEGSRASEDEPGAREGRGRTLSGALAARDHAAFSAMIYAGLRIEETTALAVEDISFGRGEEEVRVAKGKGNKERIVPMNPKLRRSLKRYLKVRDDFVPVGKAPPPHLFLNEKGERVTENTLRRRLYGWVRKSGLKKANVKPHDLRRTFGTWFLQANPGHVRELAELMGHSDLSQVMKYALSDQQRARSGVARL
ncbi:MAG: tyrosine-type recombinase/integrase [Actinomycetota bacterium]|nr:tyrosine-type recombinase/integrase [Actinomycetota bacterium]